MHVGPCAYMRTCVRMCVHIHEQTWQQTESSSRNHCDRGHNDSSHGDRSQTVNAAKVFGGKQKDAEGRADLIYERAPGRHSR